VVDFLLALTELCLQLSRLKPYERILVKIVVCERGVGHFECKFQREGASSTNECWQQKTRVPGLSRGVVCVMLRLVVVLQYRRATDRHTDRHTNDDG